VFKSLGFHLIDYNEYLFTNVNRDVFIIVFIDDLLATSSNRTTIKGLFKELSMAFTLR